MSAEPAAVLRAVPPPPSARHPPGGSAGADEIRREPVAVTTIAWTAVDELRFEEWVRNGRRLGAVGRGVGWWIGDWLRYGNARYGEKYAQAAKITGYDSQTLMNMVYVSGQIAPVLRREGLSWSHHAEVAALEPDEQQRWLTRAEQARLSVQDLRLMLRKARGVERPLTAAREQAAADHALVCPECGHAFATAEPEEEQPPAHAGAVRPASVRARRGHGDVAAKRTA